MLMHVPCVDARLLETCRKAYLCPPERHWVDASTSINPVAPAKSAGNLLLRWPSSASTRPFLGGGGGGGSSPGWSSPGRRAEFVGGV